MHPLATEASRLLTRDIARVTRLHGGDLSEVLRLTFADGTTAIVKSGPEFLKVKFKKKKAVLYFTETGRGLTTCDGKDPQEFAIAGADQQWVWAKARIKGKSKVIVWAEALTDPKAVRYAFNNNPENPNLSNETCIPAGPFRTDNWPGPTAGKR